MRIYWVVWIFTLIVSASAQNGELHFEGVLQDSVFQTATEIQLEVLETGQIDTVQFGVFFSIELPHDTLWNICFTDTQIEKCYEIHYGGRDSLFTQHVGGALNSALLFDNSEEEVLVEVLIDSSQVDPTALDADVLESEITQEINKRTKMRKTVVRLRKRPRRKLGQTTISAKSIKRMPSLAEADVIKSIQALPGVVASSDFSSKLYVRGAGADQNLFLFDNAVVYSPIHLFGLFSTFLVEGIDEVRFYKGGFTPEYGNRLASVVDVRSRKGGKDSTNSFFEGSAIKISTFASQAHIEGRYNGFRWLLAGRATYLKEMIDFFRYVGVTDIELDYRFWDRQGNLTYEFKPGQELSFSFYTGEDRLVFETINGKWGNDAYAMNYKHQELLPHINLFMTASLNKFYQEFEIEELFRIENGIESNGLKAYKATVEYEGLDNQIITTGLESQNMKTVFNFELLFDIEPEDDSVALENSDSLEVVDRAESSEEESGDHYDFWLHSAYLSNAMSLGNFVVTPGVRATYHSKFKELYYEPRISIRYKLPQNQSLDFHLGHYKQFINSLQFGDFESLNEQYYPARDTHFNRLDPSQCDMLSLGYHHPQLLKRFALTVETYYKVFKNLYVSDANSTPDSIAQSPDRMLGDDFVMGEGYSYGFEFLVRKDEGTVFGGVSYTYGRSVLQDLAEAATRHQKDSAAYFANWDQTHSIKVDAGINWRGDDGIWKHDVPGRYWKSSIGIKYASGLPYPEIAGHMPRYLIDDGAQGDKTVSTPQAGRNRARYPWYGRIDVKVFDIGRINKWSFSFTIINVLNRENVWMYNYNSAENPPEKNIITQLPILPVMLNYEYKF